jgi:ELWxxDGT repeat protein
MHRMKTTSWRQWWSSILQPRPIRSPARARTPRRTILQLEQLETRTLLSGMPQLLADINPGFDSSSPTDFVAIGSTIYFAANNGNGYTLWKTNGTTAGTVMVAGIGPGYAGSGPADLTNVNGTLFFTASDSNIGRAVWKSDGTAAGTTMVADIHYPNSSDYDPKYLTNVNGTLYFVADDGTHGYELWKSDGTTTGTTMVADITPGSAGSNPKYLTNFDGTLFFTAYGSSGGNGSRFLWKSDGTTAGTVTVSPAPTFPNDLTIVNGTLFFSASEGLNGDELWKTDGTTTGTVVVKNLAPGISSGHVSAPSDLTSVNGELFFANGDTTGGYELWKSDGTTAGTVMVSGVFTASPTNLTNVNGELFFAADDGTHGTELWKSDGTTAGTTMVRDICPPTTNTYYYTGYFGTFTRTSVTDSSNPSNLTNVNGELFFAASDANGTEFWKSDGTSTGTTLVQDINPGLSDFSGEAYVGPYGGIEYVAVLRPNSSNPRYLTNVNGTLFFSANDGTDGVEPWELQATPTPSLSVSGFPATTTAGAAGSLTVTALNADGTMGTGYTGTVRFLSTDPKATILDPITGARVPLAGFRYQFTAADGGSHSFTVCLETAGTQAISASDTQAPADNGGENGIVVQPAPASSFALTGFPSPVSAGTASIVTITAYDPYGNVATGYGGTVHFRSSDPSASLPTDVALNGGTGSFFVTLKTIGSGESITASDTQNPSLTATESGIEVLPYASISGPYYGAIGQTLTYTIGSGADPAGTVFTVSWGDGSSVQTTAATVSHAYAASTVYTVSVTATADGLHSNPASQGVSILGVSVTVEADPARPGAEVLIVAGTATNEDMVLAGNGGGVSLTFNGTAVGTILPTNGETFALVEAFGGGTGSDVLDAHGLSVSSVLVGGPGNDTLYGGSARNLLIGGAGADTLNAGGAGDILIGGTTSYNADTAVNRTALDYIMAEWGCSDSYSTRIKKLQNGGGLNGSYLLNSTTVSDDNATDVLNGGAGLDWFFAHTRGKKADQIVGLTSGEVVTGI